MRSYSSREIIGILQSYGWRVFRTTGSHHHLEHPTKPGTVTVPHPRKDLPQGTVKSIAKQAGIILK